MTLFVRFALVTGSEKSKVFRDILVDDTDI